MPKKYLDCVGHTPIDTTDVPLPGEVLTYNDSKKKADWQGAAAGGLSAFAMFYGLTAGTDNGGSSDYAATVAVGAAVPFPKNGPALGGIVPSSSTQFVIPAIGTYEVSFEVHTTEPGQLQLDINNGAGVVVVPASNSGNANPTSGGHVISGSCILTTTGSNAVLRVINPAGNATALTITPADGNLTHAYSQRLIVKRLA
jgi:hypothetical protein